MTTKKKTAKGWSNEAVENVVIWLENDRTHYAAIQSRRRVWFDEPLRLNASRSECMRVFADTIRQYALAAWPKAATPDGFELGDVPTPNQWQTGARPGGLRVIK